MSKGIKITIPEPCSQDWHNLTIIEQGRFCASCQKVVIDFRKMSDNELLAYFKNHQGNICGNFNPIQTDRVIMPFENRLKTPLFSKFIASIFGVFLSLNAKVQSIDSTKRKPLTEINPLPTVRSPIFVSTNQETKCAVETPAQQLQGRLGGAVVLPIEVTSMSNTLLKTQVFNRIEDILRFF